MLDVGGTEGSDGRPLQDLRDTVAGTVRHTACADCLDWLTILNPWYKCAQCERGHATRRRRARYLSAFDRADQLNDYDVELVLLTFTPPGIVERGEPQWHWFELLPKAAENAMPYVGDPSKVEVVETYIEAPDPEALWRERYRKMFRKLIRTQMWSKLGFAGGCAAYECKRRKAGEYVCYHRQCKCYKGRCACKAGLEHCRDPTHYRKVEQDEWHPHLHVVARKKRGRQYPRGKAAGVRIDEYTKARGFGFVNYDNRRSGDLLRAVRYATKYVTKAPVGSRNMWTFGDLYGMMALVEAERKQAREMARIAQECEVITLSAPPALEAKRGLPEGPPKEGQNPDMRGAI